MFGAYVALGMDRWLVGVRENQILLLSLILTEYVDNVNSQ
jgi:hypothetical protein